MIYFYTQKCITELILFQDTDCMPVNWLDNLPDDLKKRSSLSNNAHRKPDFEHIPELTSKESWGNINIMNDISVPESSSSRQASSSVGRELLPSKSTTICRSTLPPFHPLQSAADSLQSRGRSNNNSGQSDELDSHVTAFVQKSLKQAKQMVGEVMQASYGNGNESGEEATPCISLDSESTLDDAQLPSTLIENCVATVIAIKDLSEHRHPPAKIAGVLERAFSMLRPSCPENLAIYSEIESYIAVVKSQILALVPTTSGNAALAM
ncbi:unnamed protein product [Triticum turgidum subsp. durum]|uniref:Uncharacterized protein n=1 Tax=Triticum turgidum subsp. durum TaxID=4567 RepID=A0A9R0RBQ0_TRITD|nr:unnamed protein product [Triticum turgidum subsp. durum]